MLVRSICSTQRTFARSVLRLATHGRTIHCGTRSKASAAQRLRQLPEILGLTSAPMDVTDVLTLRRSVHLPRRIPHSIYRRAQRVSTTGVMNFKALHLVRIHLPALPRGFRRALAKTLSIFDRETAQVAEPPFPCYWRDALFRFGNPQSLPNFFEAGITQVAHGGGAPEVAKILE